MWHTYNPVFILFIYFFNMSSSILLSFGFGDHKIHFRCEHKSLVKSTSEPAY